MLIGRSSIRHTLNNKLLLEGWHIGYGVRPQFRRKGYAKEILKLSLEFIHQLGVSKVLVTCNDDNIGSIKVIESQVGLLENVIELDSSLKRRYWIEIKH